MKKLFIILTGLFLGCSSDNSQIESVEIMSYYNFPQDYLLYSKIDSNGKASTIRKEENKTLVTSYKSSIRKSLFDSLIQQNKNYSNLDYSFKFTKGLLYCGPIHSVKITYSNKKELTFNYLYSNNDNKKFKLFSSLFKELELDSLSGKKLENNQRQNLIQDQKKFEKISKKGDSLLHISFNKQKPFSKLRHIKSPL